VTAVSDHASAEWRLGIDIGGTFTDAVIADHAGQLRTFKVLSTPLDPSEGFMEALDEARASAGFDRASLAYLTHATTVATNAIFEGKGARVALLVTHGFRDILEIGRQIRPSLFDLSRRKPDPLVSRDLCFELDERIDARGNVVSPLNEAHLDEIVSKLTELELDAVVVCLLHSYANPDHERSAAKVLRSRLSPSVDVTTSSEIWPEFREYHRASTTLVNAAIRPAVRRYLARVEDELDRRKLNRDLYVMRCDGGVMTTSFAKDAPIHLIESGPAAGLIAAAHLGRTLGFDNVISFDVGGTTAKAGLALGGELRTTSEYEVGALATSGVGRERGSGYPIRVPVLDLVEIGAGGGSLIWVDSGGVLRVGPRSAGADPGPACYALGGQHPTLTDANVALGRIDPDRFLGGAIQLDAEAARNALEVDCADPLGMSTQEVAAGAIEIANASMTRLLNLVSVQRGYDPREFILVAFGGAGPLHANALAEQVGIPTVLVPPHAGALSAYGLLVADVRVASSITAITPLEALTVALLDDRFRELAEAATDELRRQGVEAADATLTRVAEMRFRGQSYELQIVVRSEGEETIEALRHDFLSTHRRTYGYAEVSEPVEVVNWKVVGVAQTKKPALSMRSISSRRDAAPIASLPDPIDGSVQIYDRERLEAGDRISGPAIISEPTATTYIERAWRGRIDEHGNILIDKAST
jgi:N-methylhydantoinase A